MQWTFFMHSVFKMAFSLDSKTAFLAAVALLSACILPAEADIRAVNQCPYGLTLFYRNGNSATTQLDFGSGQTIQLGLPNPWITGVLWASRNANVANGQCTQLEFTIGTNGRDSYDISLVNAYNEPAMINPTNLANGDTRNGLECGTISCTISGLNGVCQNGNYFAGPDGACINNDGPWTQEPTAGTNLFQNACPSAYSYNNEPGVVYACDTWSDYDAIWCP